MDTELLEVEEDEVPEVTPKVLENPELVPVDGPVDDMPVVTPETVEVEVREDKPVIEVVELVPIGEPEDVAVVGRDEVVVVP